MSHTRDSTENARRSAARGLPGPGARSRNGPLGLLLATHSRGLVPGTVEQTAAAAASGAPLRFGLGSAGRYPGAVDTFICEDLGPIGEATCTGVPGPCGLVARLCAAGSTRAHVGVLEFEGLDLPPFTTALLVGGSQGAFLPNPGGSAGSLCLPGAVRLTTGCGPTHLVGRWEGSVELPDGGAPGAFQLLAGATRRFQLWFRQAGNPPTSDLSSALALTCE